MQTFKRLSLLFGIVAVIASCTAYCAYAWQSNQPVIVPNPEETQQAHNEHIRQFNADLNEINAYREKKRLSEWSTYDHPDSN